MIHRLRVTVIPTVALLAFNVLCAAALAQGRPDIIWMAGGHGDAVNSVAYSPDGRTLASGSGDDTIKLWRVADGRLLRTLADELGKSIESGKADFASQAHLVACKSRIDRMLEPELNEFSPYGGGSMMMQPAGQK